jgi:hypothetical protein
MRDQISLPKPHMPSGTTRALANEQRPTPMEKFKQGFGAERQKWQMRVVDVRFWHKADMHNALTYVRYRG